MDVMRGGLEPFFEDAFDRVVNEESPFRPILHVSLPCSCANERTGERKTCAKKKANKTEKQRWHTRFNIRDPILEHGTCPTIARFGSLGLLRCSEFPRRIVRSLWCTSSTKVQVVDMRKVVIPGCPVSSPTLHTTYIRIYVNITYITPIEDVISLGDGYVGICNHA